MGSANRSRRNAARPRSSSTAVTVAPGVEEPAGQQPEARSDLEDRALRPGLRLGEDRLEHVDVGQEVLRQGVARPQAGRPERGADIGRIDRAWPAQRRASGSDGRASRSSAGPLPGREPARTGGPDHRPVVRAQARVAAR